MDLTEPYSPAIVISTLEGNMRAEIGDWIIKGVEGEFYPCKPKIFKKMYDEILSGNTDLFLTEDYDTRPYRG